MAVDPERPDQNLPRHIAQDDARFALGRIAIFQYFTAAVFVFLISGFWVLQVRDGEFNSILAERNRIKTVPVLAPRGRILDRDGRSIVENHTAFSLMLSRETLADAHIDPIAKALNLDPEDIRARLKRFAALPRYVPILIKQEMTPQEITYVESHRDASNFPELEIVESHKRLYPLGGFAAHVLGYVGEISEQELNHIEFAHFSQGEMIGKTGLERQYNDTLAGIDGERRVVVDSSGRERQVLATKDAEPGRDLKTTLDLDLQAVAELALEGRRGALVALDPRTGEVLAMVSRPAYDLNIFSSHIPAEYWKQLNTGDETPMMNRAIQAQFAPGSTFKPIVAMAGLETGILDPEQQVFCPGGGNYHGRYFKCDLVTGHGNVNVHTALVHSCDVFFYNLGDKLGIDKIAQYAQMTGIGKRTGIDLPNEAEGLMPSTRWKLRTQRQDWYAGETISVAIGQGAVTTTPLQLASAIGGLVSGGVWQKPHLTAQAQGDARRAPIKPETIAAIVSGMYGVVNEGGTGSTAQINGIELSGKTGSAQRVSNEARKSGKIGKDQLLDNGWFVGFAPRQNPEIVVTALLEGGEHGRLAAPIVRDVVKAYFDKKLRTSKTSAPLPLALLTAPGTLPRSLTAH